MAIKHEKLPSMQRLYKCAQLSDGINDLVFGLTLYQFLSIVYVSRQSSDKTGGRADSSIP